MSTRCTIRYRQWTDEQPGFHLFDEAFERLEAERSEGIGAPVYLELSGVSICEMTADGDGVSVTVRMPREMARALGLAVDGPMTLTKVEMPNAKHEPAP